MQILSVNTGESLPIRYGKDEVDMTGIWKTPSSKPVQITPEGLIGDHVLDVKNHAGPDQAVYVYGALDYAWWSQQLGKELAPGTFGDNLTISDLECSLLNIGDRFKIGDLVLEITAPRIPCRTLATRMGDPAFVKKFKEGERPGVYCRVFGTDTVSAGDSVSFEPYIGPTISVLDMFRIYYDTKASGHDIMRILRAPIAIRARKDNEERLIKSTAADLPIEVASRYRAVIDEYLPLGVIEHFELLLRPADALKFLDLIEALGIFVIGASAWFRYPDIPGDHGQGSAEIGDSANYTPTLEDQHQDAVKQSAARIRDYILHGLPDRTNYVSIVT